MTRMKRGQSLVEMAMVAPFLIMTLLMMIDCGRAAYTYATLAGAAREGARSANLTTTAPAGQAAAAAAGGCGAVTPSYAGHNALAVTIKYNFQPLTPFGSQFFPGGIVMTVTSTMSTEY